MMMENHGR